MLVLVDFVFEVSNNQIFIIFSFMLISNCMHYVLTLFNIFKIINSKNLEIRNSIICYLFKTVSLAIMVIFLNYKSYFIQLFYSNLIFSDYQYNMSILSLVLVVLLYFSLKFYLVKTFTSLYEYSGTLLALFIWSVGLFAINNLIIFIFFFELFSLSFLLLLSLTVTNVELIFLKTNDTRRFYNLNLFIYSFIYLFWISFLSVINLFIFLMYLFVNFNTFELSILDIIIIYNLHTVNNVFLLKYFSVWVIYLIIFLLKLGLVPFFIWKPNFFKSIPTLYIYTYVCYYFFFIFIFFLNMTYGSFYMFINLFSNFNLFFTVLTSLFLIFSLLNINNIKIFIAFSSILNSYLLVIGLFNLI